MPRDEPGAALTVRLADLLPSVRAQLEAVRLGTGFEPDALTSAVQEQFGFLGPFIACRVETGENGEEFLVVEFKPPVNRDLDQATTNTCVAQPLYVIDGGDCDDADSSVSPDPINVEICEDGKDNNCDGGAPECEFPGSFSANTADAIIYGDVTDQESGRHLSIGRNSGRLVIGAGNTNPGFTGYSGCR